jgi:hypothetical protein
VTMTITNGYVTLDEARDYIGQNQAASATLLESLIEGVSRDIDQHCGRHFYQAGTTGTPQARYFDAHDSYRLLLGPFNDLVSVSAVHIDSSATGTFSTEVTGYQLLELNAATHGWPYTEIRSGAGLWPLPVLERVGLVRVSGVWGWPSVPLPIRETCLLMVARLANRKGSPLGLAGGFGEFGAMRVFGEGWDQDAVARMAPYRRGDAMGIA